MPNFSFNVAILAGATNENILADSPFEFVGQNSKVAVAMSVNPIQTVPGTPPNINDAEVIVDINFGSEIQIQGAQAPLGDWPAGGAARIPDHVIVDDVAAAGDRLVIRAQNTGNATNRVVGLVRILPI